MMSSNDEQQTMSAETVDPPSRPGHALPDHVGPYRVLGRLGEGGMGTVYKAEQREPVRRTVAIKVVKLGMDTNEVIARFESERQALARMDHPGIARVLDAGADDKGRPYFVMEFVPGVPITQYADREKMPLKDRLNLFLQVCDAIAHAHSKAILHRDIKASNVLAFTDSAGHPIAKVIDFGVAKALTSDRLTDLTFNTQMGLAVGTYESMSPEQADGSPDVDARTDVYALGVLLYELLAGTKPLAGQMANTADVEIRRIIRDVDPVRPSVKMTTLGQAGMTKAAADRRLAPAVLAKELRSELEWIPMMCLRKERDRRYASPLILAQDVRNYLDGLPLTAAPHSRWYRVSKLAKRNKGKLAAAAVVLLTLLVGMAGTTYGLIREARAKHVVEEQKQVVENEKRAVEAQRAEAEQARQNGQAVVDFLTNDLLAKASPRFTGNAAASDMLTKTLIEPAIKTIDNRFKDQPLVRAAVQDTLARTLNDLGQCAPAEQQGKAAWDARRKLLGDDHPDTLEALNDYATAINSLGRDAEAERLLKQCWDARRRVLGDDHPYTLKALNDYATAIDAQGRHAEAERLYKQCWDALRRVQGDDHPDTLSAMGNYAFTIDNQGRHAAAERFDKQLWDARRRVQGDDHPDTLKALQNYAAAIYAQDRYAEAERLLKQCWDARRPVLGDDHPDTLTALNNYAMAIYAQGRYAEAERLYKQCWDARRPVQGTTTRTR